MKFLENFSGGFKLMSSDSALLGIHAIKGECEGCGQPVHILSFGLVFGEIYLSYHSH